MRGMRELLRSSLGRALRELEPADRLAAAWPVAAGASLASHGSIASFADGLLTITVEDDAWLDQMLSLREQLARELGRIANVPVRAIHFEGAGSRARAAGPTATPERRSMIRKPARPRRGDRP